MAAANCHKMRTTLHDTAKKFDSVLTPSSFAECTVYA